MVIIMVNFGIFFKTCFISIKYFSLLNVIEKNDARNVIHVSLYSRNRNWQHSKKPLAQKMSPKHAHQKYMKKEERGQVSKLLNIIPRFSEIKLVCCLLF